MELVGMYDTSDFKMDQSNALRHALPCIYHVLFDIILQLSHCMITPKTYMLYGCDS